MKEFNKHLKGIILIGGPQKGTRFRPLSFNLPKPLFPVAGFAAIQHHIEAYVKIRNLKEIIILGVYSSSELSEFISSMINEYNIHIRYLQEYTSLGTAGGIYHFRDQIKAGNPHGFFVMNGDVCADFPLSEMLEFQEIILDKSLVTVLATESTRTQSMNYGCIVENKDTHEILHYVEKPSTFVSTLINCGVYFFSPTIFDVLGAIFIKKQSENLSEEIYVEKDIFKLLSGTGQAHVFKTLNWWSQMKTPGSAIYANRHYLKLYNKFKPERLASNQFSGPEIIGPNVSIGANVVIEKGVRVKESIILENVTISAHSLVLYAIIGWNSFIGPWTRIEGTPCDPNPNKPFAKMENMTLFSKSGQLNPSLCILGGIYDFYKKYFILFRLQRAYSWRSYYS